MSRKSRPSFEPSAECAAAYDRILRLAHETAAKLADEELSSDGEALGPYGLPLVLAMVQFLLTIPPQDLNSLFFTEGSLKELNFNPRKREFEPLLPLFPH